MKKKIGIFAGLSSYGGVQTCVISLIRGLNNIGIIPYLITDEGINQNIINEYNLQLKYLPVRFSISQKFRNKIYPIVKGSISLFHFFKTKQTKEKMDFYYVFQHNVIVNDPTPHLYYLSMPPRDPFFFGNTWISHFKMFVYDHFLRFFIPVYDLHGDKNSFVINSNFTAGLFYKSYGWKVKVVYPSNHVPKDISVNYQEKTLIVFISRIVPAKRPEMFIKLAELYPDEQFIMIGSAEDSNYIKSLNEKIAEKKLHNIRIETNVPHYKTVEYLKKSKYYVFPAVNEHFGITTVDAMMYGAIPFVHNSGGQKEIVPWEELRFEDHELVEKFGRLLKLSPEQLDENRIKIINHTENFTEEKYIKEMVNYISFLIRN